MRRLALDNTFSYYFPELIGRIENADHITLKMMMQHRSGIPNFTDNPAHWVDEQKNGKNALEFALDLPASFKPDEDYEYSNTIFLFVLFTYCVNSHTNVFDFVSI